jgi:hypothetical protein
MSISIDVHVCDFPDDQILEAAIDILDRIKSSDRAYDRSMVNRFRVSLSVFETADDLPPPSTAARIQTRAELLALANTGAITFASGQR